MTVSARIFKKLLFWISLISSYTLKKCWVEKEKKEQKEISFFWIKIKQWMTFFIDKRFSFSLYFIHSSFFPHERIRFWLLPSLHHTVLLCIAAVWIGLFFDWLPGNKEHWIRYRWFKWIIMLIRGVKESVVSPSREEEGEKGGKIYLKQGGWGVKEWRSR